MRVFVWNVASWQPTVRNIELRHGSLAAYFDELRADVVCLQETKVNRDKLDRKLACVPGFESFWAVCRSRKGYSGVATYVRLTYAAERAEADCLPEHEAADVNQEGRTVLTDHGPLAIVNVYVPNAGHNPDPSSERVDAKCRFFAGLKELADGLLAAGKQVLLVGDFNIAPSPRDVHATYDLPSLFTQREQANFAGLEATYHDVWRRLHPEEGATFTVFDERTNARPFNRGLRIDFALASPGLLANVVSCEVVPTPPKWSDHVALVLELRDIPQRSPDALPPPCALSSRRLFKSTLVAMFARANTQATAKAAAAAAAAAPVGEAGGKAEEGEPAAGVSGAAAVPLAGPTAAQEVQGEEVTAAAAAGKRAASPGQPEAKRQRTSQPAGKQQASKAGAGQRSIASFFGAAKEAKG